jgi:TetR/AcrR family transcriptional repressor of nem operon
MRITKQRAAENRSRVVAAAAELFREKGFGGIGVAGLMHAAGLTHGGFYNHFKSKDDLEAAACEEVFRQGTSVIGAVAAPEKAADRADALAAYRRRYLSRRSRDATGASCPMVAFGADVSRQAEPVRQAYAKGLRAYLDLFARALRSGDGDAQPTPEQRRRAIAALATLAGALSLARSVAKADPHLSEEILTSALAELEGAAPEGGGERPTAPA